MDSSDVVKFFPDRVLLQAEAPRVLNGNLLFMSQTLMTAYVVAKCVNPSC